MKRKIGFILIMSLFVGFSLTSINMADVNAETLYQIEWLKLTEIYAAHTHDSDSKGEFYIRWYEQIDGSWTSSKYSSQHKLSAGSRWIGTETLVSDGIYMDSDDVLYIMLTERDYKFWPPGYVYETIGPVYMIYPSYGEYSYTFYEDQINSQGCYFKIDIKFA